MDYDSKIKKMEETNGVLWIAGPLLAIVFLAFGILLLLEKIPVKANSLLGLFVGLGGSLGAFYTLFTNKMKIEDMTKVRNQQLLINEENDLQEIMPYIAINEKKKKIRINETLYSFKDIVQCEIIEDGNVITTTTEKRKASLGKAVVGGALFGAAGAIIGGTSGKSVSRSTSTQFCSKLDVKITVNNFENPVEYIKIIDENVNKNTQEYADRSEEAQKCLSILQIVIDRK